jgi:hypothetical protein
MNMPSRHTEIKEQFSKVLLMLSAADQKEGGEDIGSIIASSQDLLNIGEEGIAFENMVENLYEIDFSIRKELFRELETLRDLLCVEPGVLDNLATLVVE